MQIINALRLGKKQKILQQLIHLDRAAYFCAKLSYMKTFMMIMMLAASTISLNAQKGFQMGLLGSFNSIWIVNQNNYQTLEDFTDPTVRASELAYKYKFGYHAGLNALYNFNDNMGVQLRLLYSNGGQNYDDNMYEATTTNADGRINVTRNVDLSYFQIPLHFKYTTSKGEKVKYYVAVGPSFGFLLGSKEVVKLDGVVKPDTSGITASDKFKKFDVGLNLNTGMNYYITEKLYLNLGLDAYYGLSDLNGAKMKALDWFSKNDIAYQKSHNMKFGLELGINYVFSNGGKRYRL